MITRNDVQQKLLAYLNRQITLADLVAWAEDILLDGDLNPAEAETLRAALARLGVADVQQFGLTWEECSDLLAQLGYTVQVRVTPA